MAFIYRIRTREQWDARATGGGDFETWLKDEYRMYKPGNLENCIRILPPLAWPEAPHYGMIVWVHYGVGPDRASVICNFKMGKGACPVCEERVRAERAKDDERIRECRAAKRVLVFLINQKDPAQGPLAWGMPQTLDQAITKIAKDRSTGEYYFVDHHETGYDVYFDKEGEALNTKYTGVALAKKPSAVAEQYVAWANEHAIPDALKWRSYDEVRRLFYGLGRGEAAEDAPEYPEMRSDRRENTRASAPPRQAASPAPQTASNNGGRSRPDDAAPPWVEPDAEPTPRQAAEPPPAGNGTTAGNGAASGTTTSKTRLEQLRALAEARRSK